MPSLLIQRGTKVLCSDLSFHDARTDGCRGVLLEITNDAHSPYRVDHNGLLSDWRYVVEEITKDDCQEKEYRDAEQSEFHTAESGAQKDLGTKPRVDLIPSEMIESVAEVLTYGAKKYDDNNWRKGLKHSIHYAAAMRHMLQFWRGVDLDNESGIHHIKHAMTNLGMIITNIETGREDLDDRYK